MASDNKAKNPARQCIISVCLPLKKRKRKSINPGIRNEQMLQMLHVNLLNSQALIKDYKFLELGNSNFTNFSECSVREWIIPRE